jgi:hypothetical protein
VILSGDHFSDNATGKENISDRSESHREMSTQVKKKKTVLTITKTQITQFLSSSDTVSVKRKQI